MRILILHMRYAPDATGTGPLVTELAEDLVHSGHKVLVVASVPHYGRQSIVPGYRKGLVSKSLESGVEIWRTWAFAPAEGNLLGRSLDYLFYLILSTLAGWFSGRHDVILCVSPPVTVTLSAWLIGRVRRIPVVFNAQDIWPDGLIAMGRLRNRFMIRLFRWVEDLAYRTALKIIVVSDGMKENLLGKGVLESKVAVIPNWVDPIAIHPLPASDSLRAGLGLMDHFIVLLAGNLGYASCLETVVEAATLLRDEPKIVFLLVGEGSAKSRAVEQAQRSEAANLHFLTTQDRARLSQVYATGDVSLVTLRSSMGKVSVPSKTYSIMASARPVLAAVPADSEIHGLIEEAKCGVWVEPENPEALAEAIRKMRADPDRLTVWGRNGLKQVSEKYTRAVCTQAYATQLKQLSVGENLR